MRLSPHSPTLSGPQYRTNAACPLDQLGREVVEQTYSSQWLPAQNQRQEHE